MLLCCVTLSSSRENQCNAQEVVRTTGLHVQQHYWLCYDANNVHDMRSQLYTQLKLKSTELLIRANQLKKQA